MRGRRGKKSSWEFGGFGESQILRLLQIFVHNGRLSRYLHVTTPLWQSCRGSACSDCSGDLQLEGPHHAGLPGEKSTPSRS